MRCHSGLLLATSCTSHGRTAHSAVLQLRQIDQRPVPLRIRLVDPTADVETRPPSAGWSQRLIRLEKRAVAIQCVPLTCGFAAMAPAPMPVERREPVRLLDWDLNLERPAIEEALAMVTLWGVSVDGEVVAAPLFETCSQTPSQPRSGEQRAWSLTWHWPGATWEVRIDPFDSWAPLAIIK